MMSSRSIYILCGFLCWQAAFSQSISWERQSVPGENISFLIPQGFDLVTTKDTTTSYPVDIKYQVLDGRVVFHFIISATPMDESLLETVTNNMYSQLRHKTLFTPRKLRKSMVRINGKRFGWVRFEYNEYGTQKVIHNLLFSRNGNMGLYTFTYQEQDKKMWKRHEKTWMNSLVFSTP